MKEIFDIVVIAFEVVAVLVLILGVVFSLVISIRQLFQGAKPRLAYQVFRLGFGKALLLALDIMVAADIILTVTLDLSFEALAALGLLVLIRTFLHFVLELEVTGRWPWQAAQGLDES